MIKDTDLGPSWRFRCLAQLLGMSSEQLLESGQEIEHIFGVLFIAVDLFARLRT